jgi:hypothetical protein
MTLDHISVVRSAADECILLFAGILILGALAGMPPRKRRSAWMVAPGGICQGDVCILHNECTDVLSYLCVCGGGCTRGTWAREACVAKDILRPLVLAGACHDQMRRSHDSPSAVPLLPHLVLSFFEVATVCRTLFAGTTQEQHSITSYSERLRSGAKLCPAYTSRLLCVASPVRSCTLTQKGGVCQSGRAGECAWRSMDQQGITHTGRGWQTEIRRRRCPTEKLCCSGASIVSVLPSSRRTNSIEPFDCMPQDELLLFFIFFFFLFF